MHAYSSSTGISLAFFGLACWFFVGSHSSEAPRTQVRRLQPGDLAIQTRKLMGDPPSTEVGGMQLSCQTCHSLFETDPQTEHELFQHEDIVLDHGLNDRCLNCHSTQDRNKLVLHGEHEIRFDQVQELCAKCHGTTFRDWEKGMHGKTLGYWDSTLGEQRRLKCTECHDPHSPAFEHIVPLPGPNSLRMGDQRLEPDAELPGKRNVLQHWRGYSTQAPKSEHHR